MAWSAGRLQVVRCIESRQLIRETSPMFPLTGSAWRGGAPRHFGGSIKANRCACALGSGLLAACTAQPQKPCDDCGYQREPDLTFAVWGDFPNGGEQQRQQLPQIVRQLNADPDIELVFHLGDIKGSGVACSTDYYREIKTALDRFQDPLVYTFGDNEWADCSIHGNGGYDPLERLAALRTTFIPVPGHTMGRSVAVTSQADTGFPENVSAVQASVSFAVFHTVGPDNGLMPWGSNHQPTAAQRAEVSKRSAAAEQSIKDAFAFARQQGLVTVVLMTHANMFPASPNTMTAAPYRSIVGTIAQETATFAGRVYLFNGDSYKSGADQPLSAESKWPRLYGASAAENLTRGTFDSSSKRASYLKVLVRPTATPAIYWADLQCSSSQDRRGGKGCPTLQAWIRPHARSAAVKTASSSSAGLDRRFNPLALIPETSYGSRGFRRK